MADPNCLHDESTTTSLNDDRAEAPPIRLDTFKNIDVKVQGGDVHSLLCNDAADDMIIPSSLIKHSRYFDQALSGRYRYDAQHVKNLVDGRGLDIYRWSLKATKDEPDMSSYSSRTNPPRFYILEIGRPDSSIETSSAQFKAWLCDTNLATNVPSRRYYLRDEIEFECPRRDASTALGNAVTIHKILFSVLIQQDFELPENITYGMRMLADVLAYADHYGLIETISSTVISKTTRPVLWEDIAKNPEFYLGVAQLLRDEKMWNETLRYIVARYCFRPGHDIYDSKIYSIGDLKEIDEKELRYVALKLRQDLQAGSSLILAKLQELAIFSEPNTRTTDVSTRIGYNLS